MDFADKFFKRMVLVEKTSPPILYFNPLTIPRYAIQELKNEFKTDCMENKDTTILDSFIIKVLCPVVDCEVFTKSEMIYNAQMYGSKIVTFENGIQFKIDLDVINDLIQYDFNEMESYRLIIIEFFMGKWPKKLKEILAT